MTITLELSPDEEARLRARAARQGRDAADLARDLVRDGLGEAPAAAGAEAAREAFLRHLLERGDIPHIPQGRPDPPPPLVPVRGEPVSETLIRERG